MIVAVCGYPEVYAKTSYSYRDRTENEIAWKKINKEVGLP